MMASDLFHPFLLGGGKTRMYEIARRLAKKTAVLSHLPLVAGA